MPAVSTCKIRFNFVASNRNFHVYLLSQHPAGCAPLRGRERFCRPFVKPQDLLLNHKFTRRMKGRERKIVPGQICERAKNLGPYLVDDIQSGSEFEEDLDSLKEDSE